MRFWLARGNITQEVKIFKAEPMMMLVPQIGDIYWLGEEYVMSIYFIERFLPMLRIDSGKCMLVDVVNHMMGGEQMIEIICQDVKCRTEIR